MHKFYDDDFFSNAVVARFGGLQLAEMNALEIAFLQNLDFNVDVNHQEVIKFKEGILQFFIESDETQSCLIRDQVAQCNHQLSLLIF